MSVEEKTFVGTALYEFQKDEAYLAPSQREHLKQILSLWREQLMHQVDETVTHLQDETSANAADPLDRAADEEAFSVELRTRDRERKLIRKIDETLELLLEDDFGYCESCGAEIGLRRLEVRPTASLCVDCKTVDEIREQRTTS